MRDEELRRVERLALAGDAHAMARLTAHRVRIGAPNDLRFGQLAEQLREAPTMDGIYARCAVTIPRPDLAEVILEAEARHRKIRLPRCGYTWIAKPAPIGRNAKGLPWQAVVALVVILPGVNSEVLTLGIKDSAPNGGLPSPGGAWSSELWPWRLDRHAGRAIDFDRRNPRAKSWRKLRAWAFSGAGELVAPELGRRKASLECPSPGSDLRLAAPLADALAWARSTSGRLFP